MLLYRNLENILEENMEKFFVLEKLFFSSEGSVKIFVTNLLKSLNCLTEDENKILLSGIPTEEDIEESIDSLILDARSIMEMKNNLSIVKSLHFLSLQEECALANRLLGEIGFSEEIETSITIEDAMESEEKLQEN